MTDTRVQEIIHDAERLAALHNADLLDTPVEEAFDRFTRLASRLLAAPIALVSLVDDGRQFFKSGYGLSDELARTRQTPLEESYCQYAVITGKPFIVEDARQHPVVSTSPAIARHDAIAYAGIPLITPEGHALGTLCVLDSKPRVWTDAEIDTLRDLTASVMTEIELRQEIRKREQREAEVEHQIKMMTILLHANAEIGQALDLDYVAMLGLDAAFRISVADSGYLGLIEDGVLKLGQVIGEYSEEAINAYLRSDESVITRVMQTWQAELISDVQVDPDYVALIPATRAKIVIPLVSHHNMIGVLNLETRDPSRFTEDVFGFLKLLAARVAVAVENARLYEVSQQQLNELWQMHSQLAGLEQLKTDMIRIAAHDLRNPLGIISGYLDLTRGELEGQVADDILSSFDMMEKAVAQMNHIISDILSLQRIETAANNAEQTDLREVVSAVVADSRTIDAGRHALSLDLPDSSVMVKGNEAHLREVVANLVGNALKYTPAGGDVRVRLTVVDKRALFEVQDTGIGIPDEAKSRLFQPFFRVKTRETREIDGTGLGLYLVKSVIERVGGRMRFDSVYGLGSTFAFELPLVRLSD